MLNRAYKCGCCIIFLCVSLALFTAPSIAGAAGDETPAAPASRPASFSPQAFLARVRARMDELKLSPEQKTKIDDLFAKAGEDLKTIAAGDVAERRQKIAQRLGELKEQVGAVLEPEQKEQMQKILSAVRPAAGAGTRPAAGGDRMAKLRDSLEKLDMTPDQKTRVLAVLDDLRTKIADLRTQAQSGTPADEIREKGRAIMEDNRKKLIELLTPEQQEKLHELMQGDAPAKPASETPAAK
jgi:Spy/CpxP family protein refolding chaperone